MNTHNNTVTALSLTENFRGNILIVSSERVLYKSSSGFADLANGILNEIDTRFASASAGKVFVAVAILQLIERGKLSFDDTLGRLLKMDLRLIDPDVTVRELLNHTLGVPDYFDETVMEEYDELWRDFPNYKIRRNSDLFPLFLDKPMMYPRGEKFQYNNSGYVLLAEIIERVMGVRFDEYLKENIFAVCGMDSTGYFKLDRLPARCANHYIYCPETNDFRINIFSVGAKGTGGAYITAMDIVKFWRGLVGGKLISEGYVGEMLKKQSGNGESAEGVTTVTACGLSTIRAGEVLHTSKAAIRKQASSPGTTRITA